MWIETRSDTTTCFRRLNSFASNGECGLKPAVLEQERLKAYNSFASNGECGLKPLPLPRLMRPPQNSFASNGECGLKLDSQHRVLALETIHSPAMANVD